jgi:archaemetzincin
MKIGILSIGQIDSKVLDWVSETLNMSFPKTTCTVISEILPTPKEAFDKRRKQHRSDIILSLIQEVADRERAMERILGIVDVDIFVPPLSFVFGEAKYPGKVAVISLHRLRSEFYGRKSNAELFMERTAKEAVHELGHTFGLAHCKNPFCVMYFSNSIFETDRKQSIFCSKCQLKIEKIMDSAGKNLE